MRRPTRRLLAEAPGVEADLGGLGLLRRLLGAGAAGRAAAEQQPGAQGGEAAWALQLSRLRRERQPWQHDAKPEGPPVGSAGSASGGADQFEVAALSVAPYLPLMLPPCALGEGLNFVGALMGTDQVGGRLVGGGHRRLPAKTATTKPRARARPESPVVLLHPCAMPGLHPHAQC
jgi:hypothetical protein